MDFNFTEEQRILKETARSFLDSECPSSFVLEMEEDEQGYTQDFWQKMSELGWMALIVPEEYEGVGGGFLDLIVMLEEMGRACVPGPFFSTVVLGALSIMEAGNESQRGQFLPGIAAGEIKATLAHTEPGYTKYDPYLIEVSASPEGNDYIIEGRKLFVPDAHVADHLICVTRTSGEKKSKDGISLFIVDTKSSGIKCTPVKTIAGNKDFDVVFDNVRVPHENLLGELHEGGVYLEKILQKATICKCAEMLGGAQKVLDMASDYAKEREQFGKLIGSFQAVQHHCANMLIDIEGSRYITYKVGWMLSKDISCAKEVAAAKAYVGDAFKKIVRLGHQILGATGYIIEHDMPLYSRRAKIAEMSFGDGNYCRQVVAQELGL
jgi:alkylation response protein AidB-like acyl-CoA dehydrogenase